MASISLHLLPLGSMCSKQFSACHQIARGKLQCMNMRCLSSELERKPSQETDVEYEVSVVTRRSMIGLALGVSSNLLYSSNAKSAGLPPEDKPMLCDEECQKELENAPMITTESGLQYKDIKVGAGPSPPVGFQVAANCVAMVPSGQIFDSSLEKGQLYIFRIGSGQVIKGLDEGILSMKVGGKRRLYIPGSLAFPKGLTSAPGRPRVAPNSPVIFDVSLEYIPGLEIDDE
ncbi:peptidyl-prolyl cis-trans isomerase FKBP16-3, chloroplastic isoform X1 [Apium graveolens]|uniref:peptidyl-prolyl cis-trans isomerase FKBP16-3, chloroplastic isoform X1 n=1 Tax=Apium graveolens TaxID=4045 RepID=UPI003D7B3AD9